MLNQHDGRDGPGADAPHEKHAATLIAQFARTGATVHRLDGGGFLVCRWGHSKACADLRELSEFAKRTGVTQ